MRDYIEERAIHIAQYIVDNGATVRQTARQFGVSNQQFTRMSHSV